MKLELRRASLADKDLVLQVREACIRNLAPEHYSADEVESWLLEKNAAGTIQRLERGLLWLGLRSNQVIGFCCGVPGEVESLFVHPAFQGFGFGRRLLAKAEEPSRRERRATIKVISTRNAAGFYAASGYELVKDFQFRFPSGAVVEAHEMRKRVLSISQSLHG
jgi:GNAT superfamily N-acetyltransferase